MLVGISEAARQLGVATETVRRMVKAGNWPAYRFGPKSLRIDVDEIKRLGRLKAGRGQKSVAERKTVMS